jgi:hypothetical protein
VLDASLAVPFPTSQPKLDVCTHTRETKRKRTLFKPGYCVINRQIVQPTLVVLGQGRGDLIGVVFGGVGLGSEWSMGWVGRLIRLNDAITTDLDGAEGVVALPHVLSCACVCVRWLCVVVGVSEWYETINPVQTLYGGSDAP